MFNDVILCLIPSRYVIPYYLQPDLHWLVYPAGAGAGER